MTDRPDLDALEKAYWGTSDVLDLIAYARTLEADRDELAERVCDECDGRGYYMIQVDGQEPEQRVCICVGESCAYQDLEAERNELRERLDVANKLIGEAADKATKLTDERDTARERVRMLRGALAVLWRGYCQDPDESDDLTPMRMTPQAMDLAHKALADDGGSDG